MPRNSTSVLSNFNNDSTDLIINKGDLKINILHIPNSTNAEEHARTTFIQTISPLLTSVRLFGLYFNMPPSYELQRHDRSLSQKNTRQGVSFGYGYSWAVVILIWLNVARITTVFTPTDRLNGVLLFKLFIWVLLCAV